MPFAALCLSLVAPFPAQGFQLDSPRERKVFQRDGQGRGKVLVAGRCEDEHAAFEAVVHVSDGTKLAWRAFSFTDVAGPLKEFRGEFEAPQGGWYSLEMQTTESDMPTIVAGVERFGVGEVFVIAGQSNSANYGEERFGALDDLVSAFDGKRWSLAADPMPGVQDESGDGSPWPMFGRLLRESLGVPIAIASVGYGGTTIGEWQPGAKREHGARQIELYSGLRDRVRALGNVRAILWHQGESDAERGTTRDEYVARFEKLAQTLDADTGTKQTWITARATFQPMTPPARMQAVREAQEVLWKRGLALQGPDTDDMLAGMRHSTDHVHFNKKGLEEHARRWHALVTKHFFAESKPGAPAGPK